jgi:SSS family solute:Na+ symporter
MAFNPILATSIIAVYMIVSIAIGIAGWRILPSSNLEDYLLADRGIGWFVGYFSTAASQLSALTMLGFIAFYYITGLAPYLAIVVGYGVFTMALYYYLAPRIWKLGRKFGHITPSDLARDYYDSDFLGYIVAIGMLIALIPYLTVQFVGVGIVITLGTGGAVPITTGAVIIGIIIAFYTLLGGMKSVAWVDAFQGVMLLGGGFLGGVILLFTVGGGFTDALNTLLASKPELIGISESPPWNWVYTLTWSLAVFLGWVFHPHMWMRIHYFESGRAVENLPWVSTGINWLINIGGICAVLAGAVAIPNVPPDQFMLLMYRNFFPTVIFAVFASAVIAAMMSSASSQCHGIAAVASRDLSEKIRPKWDESRHLTVARLVALLAIAAAVALSYAGIKFLLTSGAAAATLATALFFPQAVAATRGWKWPTKQGAIVASVAGAVSALLFLAVPQIRSPIPSIYEGLWAVIINIVLFISVSLLTSSEPSDSKIKSWENVFREPYLTLEEEYRTRVDQDDTILNDD